VGSAVERALGAIHVKEGRLAEPGHRSSSA
jgi:hypothetical protein